MWMAGFQALGNDSSKPCVALLFEEWELNSKAKFALGCLGTFFLGVLVEGIVAGRRHIRAWNSRRPLTKAQGVGLRVGMVGVYAVQVTLGYMLMLIAMTYEVELFLMVVLGLTAGHGVFNLSAPVLESAEACCAGFDPEQEEAGGGVGSSGELADPMNGVHVDQLPSCCNGNVPNGYHNGEKRYSGGARDNAEEEL
jgi:hypothetical protein